MSVARRSYQGDILFAALLEHLCLTMARGHEESGQRLYRGILRVCPGVLFSPNASPSGPCSTRWAVSIMPSVQHRSGVCQVVLSGHKCSDGYLAYLERIGKNRCHWTCTFFTTPSAPYDILPALLVNRFASTYSHPLPLVHLRYPRYPFSDLSAVGQHASMDGNTRMDEKRMFCQQERPDEETACLVL